MPKKSPCKKPALVPENPVIKDNESSPTPKKRKKSEQEKGKEQVEDESAKTNKLKKIKNKNIEAKKEGDGYFIYTAEELELRKSNTGRLRKRKSDGGGMENGSAFNVRWSQEAHKCFLSTCVQEVTKKGRRKGSLHPESWITIMEVLKENHNFVVSQKQMKNRYDYLKRKYNYLKRKYNYLKRKYQARLALKTSHVCDHRAKTINMKNSDWQEYLKAHPLLNPKLCTTLFEGTIITGVDASGPNSKDQDLYITSSDSQNVEQLDNDDIEVDKQEGNSNINSSNSEEQILCITYPSSNPQHVEQQEKEDIQVDEHEGNTDPSSPETHSKESIPPSQGDKPEEKKEDQPSSSQTKLEEVMSNALSFMLKNNGGPSVTDCMAKLDKVGWDKEEDLYLSAVVIFGSSAGHREAWMNLPKDNVKVLGGWVLKVGQIMGLKF